MWNDNAIILANLQANSIQLGGSCLGLSWVHYQIGVRLVDLLSKMVPSFNISSPLCVMVGITSVWFVTDRDLPFYGASSCGLAFSQHGSLREARSFTWQLTTLVKQAASALSSRHRGCQRAGCILSIRTVKEPTQMQKAGIWVWMHRSRKKKLWPPGPLLQGLLMIMSKVTS